MSVVNKKLTGYQGSLRRSSGTASPVYRQHPGAVHHHHQPLLPRHQPALRHPVDSPLRACALRGSRSGMLPCRQYLRAPCPAGVARCECRTHHAAVDRSVSLLLSSRATSSSHGSIGRHEPDGRCRGHTVGRIVVVDRLAMGLSRISFGIVCRGHGCFLSTRRPHRLGQQTWHSIPATATIEVPPVSQRNAPADDDLLHLSHQLCHYSREADRSGADRHHTHHGGTGPCGVLCRHGVWSTDEYLPRANEISGTNVPLIPQLIA